MVFRTVAATLLQLLPRILTDDLQHPEAELAAFLALPVEEISDVGGVFYAGFNDPDGNLWLLQEFPPTMRQVGQSFYEK